MYKKKIGFVKYVTLQFGRQFLIRKHWEKLLTELHIPNSTDIQWNMTQFNVQL